MSYKFVALGGELGAMLRMLFTLRLPFACGAIFDNLIEFFVRGIAFGAFVAKAGSKEVIFSISGIISGFTKFSAFRWIHSSFRRWVKWDFWLAISH